jgi:hypothetical protein
LEGNRAGGRGFFDAVAHFEGDDQAGGAVGIFTQEEDFGFGLFFATSRGG